MLSKPFLSPRLLQPSILQRSLSRPKTVPSRCIPRFSNPRRQYAFNNPRQPKYNNFQQAGVLWKTSPPFRASVIIVGGGLVVWIGSNIERVPISGRWRFNCVSEEYEAQLGRMAYKQVMHEYGREILSPRDPRHQLVGKVLARLLPQSGLKGDWEYHVIHDDEQINAFVIPGGKVFVFSGILPICMNEDGLAAVLGHEIAHNVAHHAQEKASLPYILTLAVGLVTLFIDNSAQLAQLILNFGVDLPNSRTQEISVIQAEADRIGLLMMARSCYSPEEAVKLWERMEKAEKSRIPQLLSTHPSNKNRIKRIQGWLPEARERQSKSDCYNTIGFTDQFNQSIKALSGHPLPETIRNDDNWF